MGEFQRDRAPRTGAWGRPRVTRGIACVALLTIALLCSTSPAGAERIVGEVREAGGGMAIGGTLSFNPQSESPGCGAESADVNADGTFDVSGICEYVVYQVAYRSATRDWAYLKEWILSGLEPESTRHVFRVMMLPDEPEPRLIYHSRRQESEVDDDQRRRLPAAPRLWLGVCGSFDTGEHFDEGGETGLGGLVGYRLIDGSVTTPDGGSGMSLDLTLQYVGTRYTVDQWIDPSDEADVTLHRAMASCGPTWSVIAPSEYGTSSLSVDAGLGVTAAFGSVRDGADVVELRRGSDVRTYNFFGWGVNANSHFWWVRDGMDFGLMARVDYIRFPDESLDDQNGLYPEDQWYGSMTGLSFALVFR